jgi:FkbM family methyltransferase
MRLRTTIRAKVLSRFPARWRLPIERFYDYHCSGDYVKSDVRAIRRLCSRDKASLDIGANKGQLTLFLVEYSSHVHCFEPVPQLSEYLRRRFQGCNVSVENCALGNITGDLPLKIPFIQSHRVDTRSSLVKDFCDERILGEEITNIQQIMVGVKRLDDLMLTNIGFIKIDVEGYEAEVLAGARETILSCQPNMLIEIEQRHCVNRDIDDTIKYVLEMGYFGYFMHNGIIRDIQYFDVKKMQNPLFEGSRNYVNNFMFSRSPL